MTSLLPRFLLLCLLAWLHPVFAQAYPDKPIRLIVPFDSGGFADMAGRRIGQALSESLGTPVIIDNRTGAGGQIGANMVAKAAPDGYTLLLGSNGPISVGPALYTNVPYDPIRDLAPIVNLGVAPIVLEVNPTVPVKTTAEFIAYAKARPGAVALVSPGIGTSSHLAAELFQLETGIKLIHVPYKGSGASLTDLVGGQAQVTFDPMSSSLPFIKAGKLRPLGVTTARRSPSLPDVPTLSEAGVPGYEASTYVALFAPAGTPRAVIDKLNAAANKALQSRDMADAFAQYATVTTGGTPEQLGEYVKGDLAKWTKVIKQAHIKAE